MLNIGTKYIDTIYFIVSSYKLSRNTSLNEIYYIPAGNVINYKHIRYIIDILYNWTNFMSNISFIFKLIMDWMNKDDILKII